jgi:hypothetical protein
MLPSTVYAANRAVLDYLNNFENGNTQNVRTGAIDSLTLNLGQTKFRFGAGEITLFDFGWQRPSALIFRGKMNFRYTPVDEIERYQLDRLAGEEIFDHKLDSLCVFFNDSGLLPAAFESFASAPVDKSIWNQFRSACEHAFGNVGIYLPNRLMGGLLSDSNTTFFYADFYVRNKGRYAYRIDPGRVEAETFYKLIMANGRETADILGCVTPEPVLLSERGVIPIDITHYDLTSDIESSGDMTVHCKIQFTPLITGVGFLYFDWYKYNRVISASDSDGEPLIVIENNEPLKILANQQLESGFGVVLNKPLVAGKDDYIDIEYECNCLYNSASFFYVSGNTEWYPMNVIRDPANFTLAYNYPSLYTLISCGGRAGIKPSNFGDICYWYQDYPVCNVSFDIGRYIPMKLAFDDLPPIDIYTHSPIEVRDVGVDMVNSLAYFTDLFGHCPFPVIRVADIVGGTPGSSPGLETINLTAFMNNSTEGPYRMANQWWKHTLRRECDRDVWIAEGLANYCSFMYFEKSSRRDLVEGSYMDEWRKLVFYGQGAGSEGTKAGPVILGKRLNNSKSKDYAAVAGYKSAYIFHMLRYMLHDFKTDSDSLFINLLNDLLVEYSDKPITTESLQELFEQDLGDMSWFFDQWVYGTDIPKHKFSYDTEQNEDGKYQVTCRVSQKDVPDGFMMVIPIKVIFDDDKLAYLRIRVDKPENEMNLPALPLKPKRIEFNTAGAVLCKVN